MGWWAGGLVGWCGCVGVWVCGVLLDDVCALSALFCTSCGKWLAECYANEGFAFLF